MATSQRPRRRAPERLVHRRGESRVVRISEKPESDRGIHFGVRNTALRDLTPTNTTEGGIASAGAVMLPGEFSARDRPFCDSGPDHASDDELGALGLRARDIRSSWRGREQKAGQHLWVDAAPPPRSGPSGGMASEHTAQAPVR